MNTSLGSWLQHVRNVFFNKDPTTYNRDLGTSYSYFPDRSRLSRGNEKTIINSIYNRIALDAAAVDIMHVQLDENNRFEKVLDTDLNNCLALEANIDQEAHDFIHDVVLSMLDEGCVAVVPIVPFGVTPKLSEAFNTHTLRTGKIVEWYPKHIKVHLYNEQTGRKEDIIVSKKTTAIITNPFYAVMNERNSTAQRLNRKLALLDTIDEKSSLGKLDLIIQLPYTVKSEQRKKQAEQRRTDITQQLAESKYGIAYTDSTERITQLNRPVENNLMSQIEYLTSMMFSQLGMTQSILDGTADDKTMLNYYNRIVDVIVLAIAREFKRKFLTKTARSRGQSIECFRDPFKLVPVSQIAEIADKFTRNEIASSNEIRQAIGLKPAKDPKADELRNSNLNHPDEGRSVSVAAENYLDEEQEE